MKIYMIENTINGKKYIGQTIQQVKTRFNWHYNNPGSPMIHNALQKYGRDRFKITILCKYTSKEELDKMEKYYIKKYNTMDRSIGYNRSEGGDGTHGYHHTKDAKEAMSKWCKGRFCGKDNHFYGKKHTIETKLKMRKCLVVMFPDGHEEIIHGIKEFCQLHNLDISHMVKVANGKRNHHKGFWCAYL